MSIKVTDTSEVVHAIFWKSDYMNEYQRTNWSNNK